MIGLKTGIISRKRLKLLQGK